jgi:hypothetical protein
MTKQEVLSTIMYNLRTNDSVDFEADDESYSINRIKDNTGWFQGWEVVGSNIERMFFENKTDLRKAVSKLGKNFLDL